MLDKRVRVIYTVPAFSPHLYAFCFLSKMYRLRALSAVSVGLAQLSRCYHSRTVHRSGQRRLMMAALAGVTGMTASAGLLWKRWDKATVTIQFQIISAKLAK